MKTDKTLSEAHLQRCLDFHGHLCPGLAIGYRASEAALERLRETRAEDEEMVAILETDACGADAVQVLTGCTFGKGNLFHKDYGKQVYTFASRRSGKGLRIALNSGAFQLSPRHAELIQKIRNDEATDGERSEFKEFHTRKSHELLDMDLKQLFSIEPVTVAIPEKARMEPSILCARCGEPTMAGKLEKVGERLLCKPCFEQEQIR
ncbi:MAG: TraR/DksA C4-type zinc finger protein [Desulfomonile tiedjei]|nr:TraR/DksA C4-type zinc finger protein [Desulfomonile tiedjei]